MNKLNIYQVDYHIRGKKVYLKKYGGTPDIRNTSIEAKNTKEAREKFSKKYPNRTIDRVVFFVSKG